MKITRKIVVETRIGDTLTPFVVTENDTAGACVNAVAKVSWQFLRADPSALAPMIICPALSLLPETTLAPVPQSETVGAEPVKIV